MRSEFDFIHSLKSKYGLAHIGDDCAVLPKDQTTDLLISADLLVEDIDFRLEWTTPELLGHKALAVSLSDIAAMGGTPNWSLISIGVPESLWNTDFLERFYNGLYKLAEQHAVEIVGGDVSRVPDKLVVDSIVLGEVASGRAILRSGARSGDAIFITGYTGGAAAGLGLLEQGHRLGASEPIPVRHLLYRQLQPLPQVDTGKLLQEYGLPTAMIDVSDGVSSDLSHILSASGVGARINAELIPADPAISSLTDLADRAIDLALHGGEDFELLFTCSREKISVTRDLGFHYIGETTTNVGIIELIEDDTATVLEPGGFVHF